MRSFLLLIKKKTQNETQFKVDKHCKHSKDKKNVEDRPGKI